VHCLYFFVECLSYNRSTGSNKYPVPPAGIFPDRAFLSQAGEMFGGSNLRSFRQFCYLSDVHNRCVMECSKNPISNFRVGCWSHTLYFIEGIVDKAKFPNLPFFWDIYRNLKILVYITQRVYALKTMLIK